MSKIITWSTPTYVESAVPHETDCLFYAENVFRHHTFISPHSIKFCLHGALPYVIRRQKIVVPAGGFYTTNEGVELECLPCKPGIRALILFLSKPLLLDVLRSTVLDDNRLLAHPGAPAPIPHFFEHIYPQSNALAIRMQGIGQQIKNSERSDYRLPPDLFFGLAGNWCSMQSETSRQIGRLKARSAATREELYRRLLQGLDMMQDQWNRELQLKHIAQHACLSPYHFHRSFREAFGLPPMLWLRRLKLDKARELLQKTTMPVTDIALACGFSDVFTFSKAFKRTWGLSPSAVQKN